MEKRRFIIQIDKDKCTKCGKCTNTKICSKINHPKLCSGCGKCVAICPVSAITLIEKTNNNKTEKIMKKKVFGHAFMVLLAIVGFSAIVMLLWNLLLPEIFEVASINFWQAMGLLALSRILFGGLGAGMMKHKHSHLHNSIQGKWVNMTPEQRKEFIDKRRRFGFEEHFGEIHFRTNEHEEVGKDNE